MEQKENDVVVEDVKDGDEDDDDVDDDDDEIADGMLLFFLDLIAFCLMDMFLKSFCGFVIDFVESVSHL